MAGDGVEREPRLDELHEPLAGTLDEILLLGGKLGAVRRRAIAGRERHHRPEALERQPPRERRHPLHGIRLRLRHAGRLRRRQSKPFAFGGVGKGEIDRRHRRAGDEPGVDLGERIGEEDDGNIDAPQERIGGPGEQPHQPSGPPLHRGAGLAGRREILGVVEDDRDPLPLLGWVDEIAFEELIDDTDRLIGVTRPVGSVAEPVGQPGDHVAVPVGVGAGQRPQPLADVVGQDDIPATEDLAAEEVGHSSPCRFGSLGWRERHEIADVPMEDEHATGAGQIGIAQTLRPARAPIGQRHSGGGPGRGPGTHREDGRPDAVRRRCSPLAGSHRGTILGRRPRAIRS